MDIGVKANSMQAFVLARNRYSSGSQLYFVRWGSESVTDDAVQGGRVHRIYNDGNMYAPCISYLPNLFLQACETGTVCIALCFPFSLTPILFLYMMKIDNCTLPWYRDEVMPLCISGEQR